MSLSEKSFEFKEMDFHYWTVGSSKNEALVLIHPAFADHNIFIEQFNRFKDQYFIVSMDMIGHGKNQKGKSSVTIGDMPEIISKVLISSGVGKCNVVGVSMGSLIAQGFADKYPEKIKSVTIVGGYSIHKDNREIQKKQGREMFRWLGYMLFSMKRFRDYIVDVSVNSDKGKAVFREGAGKFKRSSILGMQGMDRIFRKTDKPIGYPLLIICGEYDLEITKNAGRSLEILEPSSKYIEIRDAGHCANIDNPDEFNKVLKEFIKLTSV